VASGLAGAQLQSGIFDRLIPPGGRLEVIVTGPPKGARAALGTRCVDTGPAGDPNPEMVLADLVSVLSPSSTGSADVPPTHARSGRGRLVRRHPPIEDLKRTEPHFIATFTEDKQGFYINNEKIAIDAKPMLEVKVGRYQHWRIVNATDEIHPMHLHQAHFLAYAENGVPLANPVWVDTVNVPYRGSVDMIVDFTDRRFVACLFSTAIC
jgi:suppressor of ftsI